MKLKRTKKPLDTNVKLPEDAIFRIFGKLLLDLEVQPLNRKLHTAVRQRDVRGLLDAVSIFNPQSIVEMLGNNKSSRGACTFAKLYQVGALIKKFPFKSKDITDSMRADKALEAFEKYEKVCELYNTQNYRALCRLSQSHPDYYGLVDDLKREIQLLIGDSPDIESVYEQGRHGPGQCTASQFKDGMVTKFFKYSNLPYTVSGAARPHAIALISSDPRWIGALLDWYRNKMGVPMWMPINMDEFWSETLQIYDYSTLATVPKTAIIDRTIEMGPSLNVFLQLGVDAIIRKKLKRGWGYDLNTQERNQKLALEGSIKDNLATIDLQGASDCISLKLCELLLPPLWYDLLLELRTASCIYKSDNPAKCRVYHLHKMSAMGNGFTFVLESLLFGAAARVAMRRTNSWSKSSVYGDDIIVPSETANTLIDYLNLMGFTVNKDKTFITGPFRESCGKDFYNGYDVRPFFITKQIKKVSNLFHLLNSFTLQEKKWEWHDMSYSRVTETLRTWVPEHFAQNYLGPQTEDTDTHLFSDAPLRFDKDGYRFFNRLVERAHIQHTPKDSFLFRKLMVDLRQVPETACPQKWDWSKKFDTGNAFDVTKRGATFFCCVRSYVP